MATQEGIGRKLLDKNNKDVRLMLDKPLVASNCPSVRSGIVWTRRYWGTARDWGIMRDLAGLVEESCRVVA